MVLPELAEPHLAPPAVSDLRQDLAQFDQRFGLPPARLRVVTRLAGAAAPWLANGEEVLDVEMAHVVAPDATLAVVLVKTTALNSTAKAVTAAVAALRIGLTRGGVISISAAGQAGGEHCDTPAQVARLHAALRAAASHHVTVVAASGDVGVVGEPCSLIKALTGGTFTPVKEANLPASDPLVLAAGGTSLTASHKTGAYISETGWGLPFGDPGSAFQASGGGFSRVFARPGYQDGVPGIGGARGLPDVSADASGHTGMALVISEGGGKIYIRNSGGTSASAPIWAGMIALADQYAGRHLGFVNPAIYRIARGPRATRPSTTSRRETTPRSSRRRHSTATGPRPAGIRSPAGAAPTHASSSPCSPTTADPARHRVVRTSPGASGRVPRPDGTPPGTGASRR